MYDIPAAASGDAGLEGFSVTVGERRIGRLAAINRRSEGLVLVVDTGDAYRAAPASAVAAIETLGRIVRLSADGESALASVEARALRADSAELIRHIPRELARLVVEGEPPQPEAGSRRRMLGAVLAYVGVVALFITAPVAALGPLHWFWVLLPALVFAIGAAILWRELDAESGRRLTAWEKAADIGAFLLGISPRTRRRG